MTDLELALRELDVEWPATPDIAAAVRTRIAAEPAPRRRRLTWPARGWRMQLAYVAAALAILFAGHDGRLARRALDGAALARDLERRDPPRAGRARSRAGSRSASRTTLDELRDAGVPVLLPSALGDADAGYLTRLPDGTQAASLLYGDGPILVQTFRARATPFIEKTIHSGAQLSSA